MLDGRTVRQLEKKIIYSLNKLKQKHEWHTITWWRKQYKLHGKKLNKWVG